MWRRKNDCELLKEILAFYASRVIFARMRKCEALAADMRFLFRAEMKKDIKIGGSRVADMLFCRSLGEFRQIA